MKNLTDPILKEMTEQHIVLVSQGLLDRPDIIPMWFGEGDKTAPECVRNAAIKALQDGDSFYTEKRGRMNLRQALNDYQKRIYGADVGVDRISFVSSGMSAIQLALQAILSGQESDNDNVVIVGPIWPNATSVCRFRRAEARYCLLQSGDNGLYLDLELLESLVDDKTKAIIVNTPNNPSGWVMADAEMEALLAMSREKGIWVIADEVYNRLSYTGRAAPSFLTHIEAEDLCIVVNSFSKAWAMTGWRAGWLVHPVFMSDDFNKLIEFNYSCVPGFVQAGCLAALEDGESFISDFIEYCRLSRDVCLRRVGGLVGVESYCSIDAGFYLYFRLGFGDAVADSLGFARRLADEGGVGLAPGSSFGEGQEGWMRLCFARGVEDIEEAFDRMEKFFSKF